jgi:pimeloyl-ACP methyl ester carboxylesterase
MRTSPPKKSQSRRQRAARVILGVASVLLALPLALLWIASFLFSLRDRDMREFAPGFAADSSGRAVRYYEAGPPDAEWNIVFIHGTPATAAIWGEQFRRPFPRARLLALDRPGFGGSGPGRRVPSLDDNADAVGAVLSRLPARKTILVGHSYGAPVALLAALKLPNQVAGVVLIGGSVDPAQERVYAIQRLADWPLVSWLEPGLLRQCNRELLSLRQDLVRLRPRLASLAAPVVMLHGGKDAQVPPANMDYLRDRLASAGKSNLFERLFFPEYNHFIPWEHPEAVTDAIQTLADRLKSNNKRP